MPHQLHSLVRMLKENSNGELLERQARWNTSWRIWNDLVIFQSTYKHIW